MATSLSSIIQGNFVGAQGPPGLVEGSANQILYKDGSNVAVTTSKLLYINDNINDPILQVVDGKVGIGVSFFKSIYPRASFEVYDVSGMSANLVGIGTSLSFPGDRITIANEDNFTDDQCIIGFYNNNSPSNNRRLVVGIRSERFVLQALDDTLPGQGGGSYVACTRINNNLDKLNFYNSDIPFFVVDFPSKEVGLGTTNPKETFHLNGNMLLDNTDGEKRLIFSNGISTSYFFANQSTKNIGLYDATNNRNLYNYNSTSNLISFDNVSKINITPHAFDITNSRLGVGLTTPSYGLHVYQNVADYAVNITNDGNNVNRQGILVSCGTTNASGTNVAMVIADGDGTAQGSITFTNGTVTYGTFTANHDAILPNEDNNSGYEYGTLVGFSSITYKTNSSGQPTERGILYYSEKSTQKYQKNLLGAYSGKYDNEENLHQVAVLGDGHILCCGETGNISVGDGITSSSTEGLGMKMDKPGLIIGIAQENVSFAGTEAKLVAVQYGLQYYIPDDWFD